MTASLPKVRLYVSAPLVASGSLDLPDNQAHYLRNVLRLKHGDTLGVFNGRNGEWQAHIDSLGKGRCVLAIDHRIRPQQDEPGPWLLFAPIKKTGVDFVVEKATELGASRLWPVFTEHTQSGRINLERLWARAVEASEQCRRLTVPEIADPTDLSTVPRDWPDDRRLIVLDERGASPPLADVIVETDDPSVGFLVGPEGGFAASELDALAALPFVSRATLGPRILRAETAALAALVCWQALAGDWNQMPAAS